jgi:Zn-dependent peptidase ImmA (M78 family)/transcriptional regulator with XRE-family HTH domain
VATNPQLLIIARESRGLTQKSLSAAVGISQSKLSKYERGDLRISEPDLAAFSEFLGYTKGFFLQDEAVFGFGTGCVFHRKQSSTSRADLRTIQAQLNVFRMQMARLVEGVEIESRNQFCRLDVDEFGGAKKIATQIRAAWGLPLGPVRNLTAAVERAGYFVTKRLFGTRKLDAVSQTSDDLAPVVFVNSESPGDRLRFSLAHEIGHLVMHSLPTVDMEAEANEFASEFLMPAREIGPDLRNLSIDKLPALKAEWKVSMQALIKRAGDLERISPRQCQVLFMQMAQHGWRLREPIEIECEEATVVRNVASVQLQDNHVSLERATELAYLTRTLEFQEKFLRGDSGFRLVGVG